ncbi:conserved hypothetical protein [Rhodococcus phage E3]|uniref:Holliday junction resolvase n=1 Tax=Rhodococcus phage E3 TaxID=1007869 RepID=UPI0002C6C220|nr:Holliday junction resolvase [Rhodococcus phage E3]AEQ21073.1 conserved hypothetical protein [Rhodococcus phage E3]
MPEKNWERHEREIQELLGLRATIASGNQWHDPSDGVTPGHYSDSTFPLMVDCKCTTQKSFSLSRTFFADWRKKAEMAGKRFLMPVRFEYKDGRIERREDYVILALDDLVDLLENRG